MKKPRIIAEKQRVLEEREPPSEDDYEFVEAVESSDNPSS